MDSRFFIGDLSEEVGKLTTIKSFNPHYEEYSIQEIEGKKFIVGSKQLGNPYIDPPSFDGPELLFSFLQLIKGPLPVNGKGPGLDEVITDKSVLTWCEKYGIPYQDKELNFIRKDDVFRENLLHLGMFKQRIAWLYASFSLWVAITEENEEDIEKLRYVWESDYQLLKALQKENAADQMEMIKNSLANSIDQAIRVQINLAYENGQHKFKITTESLLSLAYYQLAALTTKPFTDTKKKMKECLYCHSPFWAKGNNSKYCPNCNRKTIWARKNKKS